MLAASVVSGFHEAAILFSVAWLLTQARNKQAGRNRGLNIVKACLMSGIIGELRDISVSFHCAMNIDFIILSKTVWYFYSTEKNTPHIPEKV